MPFKNRIRLPFYLTRPQFQREANVFRRADGSTKVQSVIIKKTFDGETGNLPKEIHERLLIALSHDDVTIEGNYLLTGISLDGDYDIDWNKFLDFPLAKAAFKAQVTPFNYSNDNCQTCEDVSQVVCVDDNIGTVNENDTITVHPLTNDSICCKPVTISLVTYNTDYLDSCIISGNDIIIHAKPILADANNIVLVTYRAQCPNGSYDEANVIGNITGSGTACLTPTNITADSISYNSAHITWTEPAGAISYEWSLYLLSDLINPVQTGTATTTDDAVTINSLTAATQYRLYVRTVCGGGNFSSYGYIDFTTDPAPNNEFCGEYNLFNSGFALHKTVTYIDCNGVTQNVIVSPLQNRTICALQTSPGIPMEIIASAQVIITYIGLC